MEADCYVLGDSRRVLKRVADDSVDLIVTDPPYGIRYRRTRKAMTRTPRIVADTPFESHELLKAVVPDLARVLRPGGSIYLFAPGGRAMFRQGADLVSVLDGHFDLRQALIWDKLAIGVGTYWRSQFESIVMASKGPVTGWSGGHSRSNILRYGRPRTWPGGHPTPKPVDLLKELIEASSKPGDLVLDPFAGSGATAAAACELGRGRRFLAIDIDSAWSSEVRERHGLTIKTAQDYSKDKLLQDSR